ncbi:MAG: tRNA glutamyl-Q(34) synthetase GluQRS [Beijerinckiaceae bacterium]
MTHSFVKHVFRFAPSPNGYLHLGHAFSALMNHEMAIATGGTFLLRIEDIDRERCRPEFEQAIYEDLQWLGIDWGKPVRRQSQHFADYANALRGLEQRGLIYPCFCSRSDVMHAVSDHLEWPRDPDGSPLYPGTCRHLSPQERRRRLAEGRPAAFRLDMEAALAEAGREIGWREYGCNAHGRDVVVEPSSWGDVVLARKDVPASYHIAVVVDDALQGVTNAVRGEDLFMATSLHRLLQVLLDLPAPCYHHHELLRDSAGRKLSKSLRAKSLRALRHDGFSPARVKRQFGLLERNFGFVP